jgi:hypothetical protein
VLSVVASCASPGVEDLGTLAIDEVYKGFINALVSIKTHAFSFVMLAADFTGDLPACGSELSNHSRYRLRS